jgi:hypothetical protein
MSVAEFRAVVAHEFAHFYSGDTRLGPLIYKTRSAMARTLENLSSSRSQTIRFLRRFWVAQIFHTVVVGGLAAYWKLFLQITHLVSRQQEYRSDELACYSAGSNAMAQGLERVHTITAVCQSFWNTVAGPALYAGYRPPHIRDPPGTLLSREQRTQRAANLLWMALAIRLVEQGWTLHMPPGQLFLSQKELLLPPQETIQAFRAGKLHPTVWRDWCREHRLESVALADPGRLN